MDRRSKAFPCIRDIPVNHRVIHLDDILLNLREAGKIKLECRSKAEIKIKFKIFLRFEIKSLVFFHVG